MALKLFPEEAVDIDAILDPIKKALRSLVDIKRTEQQAAEYDGFCCKGFLDVNPPDHAFSEAGLKYHEERDRGPLDIGLLVAFQLGICQGMLIERKHTRLLQKQLDLLHRLSNQAENSGKDDRSSS